jgi:DNA topoisomerase IA
MVPTALGIALVQALDRCDDSLVKPNLRAGMEQQVARYERAQ